MGEFFQIQVGRHEALAEKRLQLSSFPALVPLHSSFSAPAPTQDDYLDLFGDPSVTGKIGTDIQDNKCSWLVVQCLQRASPEQRQILQVPERGLWIPELLKKGIEQWFFSGGDFAPPPRGRLAVSGDIFLLS